MLRDSMMDLARCLAERGRYTVAPNPLVGTVIAQDGKVTGEGWHSRAGESHAEIVALEEAGGAASGATMYVTLEPCNHHGRTPPCVEAILRAGISRVVVGHLDPDPRMRGRSVGLLRDAGVEVMSAEALGESCRIAAESGLAVAIHAIGDRAVRQALDAIEGPLRSGLSYPLPPRVEHVQLIRFEDIGRFRSLGALASVQPIHQVTDREVARAHWGSRTARSYAYKALLDAGAPLLFGSDAPFDRPGPLLAIQAALTRRAAHEPAKAAFHPEQRLRLAQALRAHLEAPHAAAGWGDPLGRLEAGYGADLVHFDHDLGSTPIDSWHQARVCGVWVSGKAEMIEKT